MTLHTRVMVTSPGVDPRATFDKMRELLGASDDYTYRVREELEVSKAWTYWPSYSMDLGQGLPALMWVDHNGGQPVSDGDHDAWCSEDEDCTGEHHIPAGYVEVNYDTAYSYRAENGASCSDLHAWITREITAWLDEQGATWVWHDESGSGWLPDLSSYGTLGDPEVGRPGSTVERVGPEDEKRAFGALAMSVISESIRQGGEVLE